MILTKEIDFVHVKSSAVLKRERGIKHELITAEIIDTEPKDSDEEGMTF